MIERANNNCATIGAAVSAACPEIAGDTPASTEPIHHIYVHIPFWARICPYCAFYKELLDRSQTQRFCDAILSELRQQAQDQHLLPATIYFGGGTPTALTTPQLDLLMAGFRDERDLSA